MRTLVAAPYRRYLPDGLIRGDGRPFVSLTFDPGWRRIPLLNACLRPGVRCSRNAINKSRLHLATRQWRLDQASCKFPIVAISGRRDKDRSVSTRRRRATSDDDDDGKKRRFSTSPMSRHLIKARRKKRPTDSKTPQRRRFLLAATAGNFRTCISLTAGLRCTVVCSRNL